MTTIITRTESCICGGTITVVLPGPNSARSTAVEIQTAVARHNRTPEHQEMSRIWESEWLHPYDPGYPHDELLPDA